jgi:hypothetical protein
MGRARFASSGNPSVDASTAPTTAFRSSALSANQCSSTGHRFIKESCVSRSSVAVRTSKYTVTRTALARGPGKSTLTMARSNHSVAPFLKAAYADHPDSANTTHMRWHSQGRRSRVCWLYDLMRARYQRDLRRWEAGLLTNQQRLRPFCPLSHPPSRQPTLPL